MSRRLLRSRMFWVLLLFGSLFFGAWWRQRPLAVIELPNGTKIFLKKITVGTEHSYKPDLPPGSSIWAHVRQIFSKPQVLKTEREEPVFHLDVVPPEGTLLETGMFIPIEMSLSDGRVVLHHFDYNSSGHGEPLSPSTIDTRNGLIRQSITGIRPFLLVAPHYDRHKRSIPVYVHSHSRVHPWTLPNPLFGRKWPEWRPESFPIIRQVGKFTLQVNGWKSNDRTHGSMDVTLLAGDTLFEKHQYWAKFDFEDPTGQTDKAAYLSRAEPALRARIQIVAGRSDPFDAPHRAELPNLTLPAKGAIQVLSAPPELVERGIHFIALVGEGDHVFENGRHLPGATAHPKWAAEPEFIDWQDVSGGWRMELRTAFPSVVTIQAPGTTDDEWDVAMVPSLNIEAAPPYQFMTRAKEHLIPGPRVFAGGKDSSIYVRPIRFEGEPPASGGPPTVSLHYTWPKHISVDVFVAPPPKLSK